MVKKKPTLGPLECSHCHKVWYGPSHTGEWVPEGYRLCLSCWSKLDGYLLQHFRARYNTSWHYMKPEDIPFIPAEGRKWIADPEQKPLRPKNVYRGGSVPRWMQSAVDKGLVQTNSDVVYIVTVNDADEAVSVETSQDRTGMGQLTRKQSMW